MITGDVKFRGASSNLPARSCINIALRDVSILDVAAFTLASTQFDVSGKNLFKGISYKLSSKKPVDSELQRTYSLFVTINIGWCRNSKSSKWIKKGDYFTDSLNKVEITRSKNSFVSDITLKCYG